MVDINNRAVYKLIMNTIKNTSELGQLIRSSRKNAGMTLQQASVISNTGVRFLSELERGKETAEIGKVISALHAVGLEINIIQKQNNYQTNSDNNNQIEEAINNYKNTLSEQLNLEFPYDLANPDIDDATFIRLVLAKTRFNDILRIAHFFGLQRIELELDHFIDQPQFTTLFKLISHIHEGILIAENTKLEKCSLN